MKTLFRALAVLALVAAPAMTQESAVSLDTPSAFRQAVSLEVSLADVSRAAGDMEELQALAERVLVLDGTAASITVYSTEPDDFYVEVELVGGAWNGLDSVEMYSAYVILDDPVFADRVAERVPRDPPPELIVRNDRILVAGRLVSVAETPEGTLVPVIQAFDIRGLR
tara:strand:- start:76 stop:579 length:504 start_codon:yes stop_codon:yes gene_type:complete